MGFFSKLSPYPLRHHGGPHTSGYTAVLGSFSCWVMGIFRVGREGKEELSPIPSPQGKCSDYNIPHFSNFLKTQDQSLGLSCLLREILQYPKCKRSRRKQRNRVCWGKGVCAKHRMHADGGGSIPCISFLCLVHFGQVVCHWAESPVSVLLHFSLLLSLCLYVDTTTLRGMGDWSRLWREKGSKLLYNQRTSLGAMSTHSVTRFLYGVG